MLRTLLNWIKGEKKPEPEATLGGFLHKDEMMGNAPRMEVDHDKGPAAKMRFQGEKFKKMRMLSKTKKKKKMPMMIMVADEDMIKKMFQ